MVVMDWKLTEVAEVAELTQPFLKDDASNVKLEADVIPRFLKRHVTSTGMMSHTPIVHQRRDGRAVAPR